MSRNVDPPNATTADSSQIASKDLTTDFIAKSLKIHQKKTYLIFAQVDLVNTPKFDRIILLYDGLKGGEPEAGVDGVEKR